MKTRLIFCLFILVLLLGVLPLAAQELPKSDSRNNDFMALIEKIKTENHITVSIETRMPVGTEYKLPDGTSDKLKSGDDHGIWGHEFSKFYGITYEQFLLDKKIPVRAENVAIVSPPTEEDGGAARWYKQDVVIDTPPPVAKVDPWYMNPVDILILLAFLGAIAKLIKRRHEARERGLTQNPVTSGPPIVAGGIPATDTERLANHFQDRAIAQYVQAHPGINSEAIRPSIVRVGPIEEGMVSGEGMVGYADRARPRRITNPEPGYRARFRFPDGSEPELVSLQRCMNPCYYGEGMTGFAFTVGRVAVAAPVPVTPAPEAVPHPAMAMARIRTAAEGEGHSTLAIGDRIITFDRGVHLAVDEATGDVKVSGTSFDMTVKPKRKRSTDNSETLKINKA